MQKKNKPDINVEPQALLKPGQVLKHAALVSFIFNPLNTLIKKTSAALIFFL